MVFIDCDKEPVQSYYDRAVTLAKKGGVIAVDNVLWYGRVNKAIEPGDNATVAIAGVNRIIKNDSRVSATMLPCAESPPLPVASMPPDAVRLTAAYWLMESCPLPSVMVPAYSSSAPLVVPGATVKVAAAELSKMSAPAEIVVVPPSLLNPRIARAWSASVPAMLKVPVP